MVYQKDYTYQFLNYTWRNRLELTKAGDFFLKQTIDIFTMFTELMELYWILLNLYLTMEGWATVKWKLTFSTLVHEFPKMTLKKQVNVQWVCHVKITLQMFVKSFDLNIWNMRKSFNFTLYSVSNKKRLPIPATRYRNRLELTTVGNFF